MFTYIYIYAHTCMHMYAHVCTCMHMCPFTHARTDVHTKLYTHRHIHIHVFAKSPELVVLVALPSLRRLTCLRAMII